MCGLVGLAGKLEYRDEATMKRLLILDYFRGTDSTGLASVAVKDNKVRTIKRATHPINLFDSKGFDIVLNGNMSSTFIGHNRAATIGDVNEVNAHPFHCGHIIGAHNGTLDRESWERLVKATGVPTGTDSEAIFKAFEKLGVPETIALMEEGRDSSKGAWALTWFDTNNGTINFLRNKHRPLWYAYTDDFRKVLWASEWAMIDSACKMSAYDYEFMEDKDGYDFTEFPEDVWHSYKVEDFYTATSRVKPTVKKLKGRAPRNFIQPTSVGSDGGTSGVPWGQQKEAVNKVVELCPPPSDRFAGLITKNRFKELTTYGCSFCGEEISWEDQGLTVYDSRDIILCDSCGGHKMDTHVHTSYQNFTNFKKVNKVA